VRGELHWRPRWAALTLCGVLAGGCGQNQTAIERGDRLWADSDYTSALAEYRLALARHTDRKTLLRVAHAYAHTGDLTRAQDTYSTLLSQDSSYADQAIYDYMDMARAALKSGDRHGIAAAVEAALQVQPALPLDGLDTVLAKYYADTGDTRRAVEFYQRALIGLSPDSAARYLYAIGRLYELQGDCGDAIAYLTAFQPGAPASSAQQAAPEPVEAAPGAEDMGETLAQRGQWVLGSCAFELAKQAHQAGQLAQALGQLKLVTSLGVPHNVQDLAWFDSGEILFALGRKDDALNAYYRVLELNPSGEGQLVDRARRRIEQIRFGT
jgi:tetratricopeptide (TPR) repeat protein